MTSDVVFTDLNRKFKSDGTLTPESDAINKDVSAINGSIQNIITTNIGERLWLPTFGSRINNLLFDPVNEITAQKILTEFIVSIRQWEPRVQLIISESSIIPFPDQNRFDVTLVYRILLNQELARFETQLKAR